MFSKSLHESHGQKKDAKPCRTSPTVSVAQATYTAGANDHAVQQLRTPLAMA